MSYKKVSEEIKKQKETWLVTGAAGFIGTNLCKRLLELGQNVWGMDNFALGKKENIALIEEWGRETPGSFHFFEGDISRLEDCEAVFENKMDRVLNNAALGSIPRSIENPINSHHANVTGILNMLWTAYRNHVKGFVFASSSSVYGDETRVPKIEDRIGRALAPYASTKYMNELYADVFYRTYKFNSIGLRYFNVFGPHQRPEGPYAAVIPKWINQVLKGESVVIYGDGETTRDFCYVENVIQMNLLAARTENPKALNQIYNVACHDKTSLNELFDAIRSNLRKKSFDRPIQDPEYTDFRKGDVRQAMADISKAKALLGYEPVEKVGSGLEKTIDWYLEQ